MTIIFLTEDENSRAMNHIEEKLFSSMDQDYLNLIIAHK